MKCEELIGSKPKRIFNSFMKLYAETYRLTRWYFIEFLLSPKINHFTIEIIHEKWYCDRDSLGSIYKKCNHSEWLKSGQWRLYWLPQHFGTWIHFKKWSTRIINHLRKHSSHCIQNSPSKCTIVLSPEMSFCLKHLKLRCTNGSWECHFHASNMLPSTGNSEWALLFQFDVQSAQ